MDEYLDFPTFFNETLRRNGTTLQETATATGIAIKHLKALSDGRYEDLPAAPYLHGYLVKLGGFLEFDAEEWWSRIKTEAGLHQSGREDTLPKNRFVRKISFSPWLLGTVILVVIFTAVRLPEILGMPELVLVFPGEAITNAYYPETRIAGTVRNANALYINGERVAIRSDGAWDKELFLQPGLTTIEVRAKKILGRETKAVRQFLYEPSATPSLEPSGSLPSSDTTSTISEGGS